jgi:hypothetical protein
MQLIDYVTQLRTCLYFERYQVYYDDDLTSESRKIYLGQSSCFAENFTIHLLRDFQIQSFVNDKAYSK